MVDNLFHVDEKLAERADDESFTDEMKLLLISFAALQPERRAPLMAFFQAMVPADPHDLIKRRQRLGSLVQTPIPCAKGGG